MRNWDPCPLRLSSSAKPMYRKAEMLTGWLLVVLPALCPDKGDQLRKHVHLPSTESATERGPGRTVCELWVQRLRIERLTGAHILL